LHEKPHLVISYVAAGHKVIPPIGKPPAYPVDRDHKTMPRKDRRRRLETPVGLRPPCASNPPAFSS
ncbi:MAG: hypothetical protein KDK08_10540, partial [Rhizobiaceae bacterium]|nr:hypothetical protein [Rhizobiaceae bacterium]